MDLNAYTVISPLSVPHCEEGHEHFGSCPDCDARGMQPAGEGLFRLCKTCKGTRQGGPSLGLRPCDFPATPYMPGQTLHLSAKVAAPLIAAGLVAPSGMAAGLDELMLRASASRLGYEITPREA